MGEFQPPSSPLPTPVFIPPQSSRHVPPPSETPAPPPTGATTEATPPSPNPSSPTQSLSTTTFPLPKLRLEIRDLNHKGTPIFLTAIPPSTALQKSVQDVLKLLYISPTTKTTTVPPTRSVTLILRSMPGVAYTTGTELDPEHKEIHFSLDYIQNSIPPSRREEEIMGVLTHEMVHCYQYDAFGTCAGGLIEGVADWVRLHAGLSPPHWKKEASGKWDAGYQHTGYFLEYLERRFGKGLVRRLNEKLRIEKYQEKRFWTELCGRPVELLWADYRKSFKKGEGKEKDRSEEEGEEEGRSEDEGKEEGGRNEDEECVIVEKEDTTTPTKKGSHTEPKSTPTK
ncbi:hypothetical protein HYFRA_00010902 [Hymenoscyphus fraxineus]|uniref:BSP-domain-containing protein n=1 Tax=Hymenoscyphus fraxineus TaxID=746836 RepID=A0A9N9KVM7_9HELO|nr:hypothetical protein HYFRA_00010902 [Hymenoscyphus fraxineus]